MNEGDLSNGAFREGASPLTTGVSDGAFREGAPPLTAGINRSGPMVRRSAAITILLVGIAVLLFLAWFGTMHYLVPGFEREFAERKLKLPYVTELTISGSRWTVKYWYAAVAGLLFPGLGLIGAISYLVRHHVRNGMWSVIWFGFVIGFPLIGHLLVWMTLFIPLL